MSKLWTKHVVFVIIGELRYSNKRYVIRWLGFHLIKAKRHYTLALKFPPFYFADTSGKLKT